jgi:hypothetical protein
MCRTMGLDSDPDLYQMENWIRIGIKLMLIHITAYNHEQASDQRIRIIQVMCYSICMVIYCQLQSFIGIRLPCSHCCPFPAHHPSVLETGMLNKIYCPVSRQQFYHTVFVFNYFSICKMCRL